MKHKGCKSEILKDRDQFILKTFTELKRTLAYRTMYDISKAIVDVPADHHYIGEKMAVFIWKRWKKTHQVPNSARSCKLKLYTSFIAECEKIKDSGLKDMDIIRNALERPAPCLGISHYRIFAILRELKQK